MGSPKFLNSIAVATCLASFATAQNQAETCYGPGSVVGAVMGTLVVILGLLVFSFFVYKIYWKNRKGKHLVLMTDSENPLDQYTFDNPCFREATSIKHSFQNEKQSSKLDKKGKWVGCPPIHSFGKEQKSEKITSMDDSCINSNELASFGTILFTWPMEDVIFCDIKDSRLKIVTLKSHDFTGLGFNICGNMRDGIFVKDVLHRGPAFESGCITTGDRIDSVCISFRNMVFEDALTILSYASPYDVQFQMENDSFSRPSTLMRSKRESNAVNSSDRILHPKFNRSQSISHLNEIGKTNNRKIVHQIDFMLETNRINHSLNKFQDFNDCPIIKGSSTVNHERTNKNFTSKISPFSGNKKSSKIGNHDRESESEHAKSVGPQNKLQKFGIKVLPITINPKMGIKSVSSIKKPAKNLTTKENELIFSKEKPEKPKEPPLSSSPTEKVPKSDEPDGGKENMKSMLAKGIFTLKEKINQNTLGKKKKDEDEYGKEEENGNVKLEKSKPDPGGNCPVPKLRSSVACGLRAYEQNQKSPIKVPEEVSRAGDIARNSRKSLVEAKKCIKNLDSESISQAGQIQPASDSEESSDKESIKEETKRTKRSKGKAPAPPKQIGTSKEINEIKTESEISNDEAYIFEPESKTVTLKSENEPERSSRPSYDSDSDSELATAPKVSSSTKIELNATQVTIHQSPSGDVNDDDVEPSRKAASLGDLSKLDSDQPLSIVLERAVSLDLTEGQSQCGKKRKAPLPPSEEFSGVFDDLNYRKEPRLEDLSTFQRRLKKSSDFGTLEDAFSDGPLEIEVNKQSPFDLTETHNYNIQEFSSWLAECRRPKTTGKEKKNGKDQSTVSSTSLINIQASDSVDGDKKAEDKYEYQGGNVSFSVNGKNFAGFEMSNPSENTNFSGTNSRTVLVISQPNSLEPSIDDVPKEASNEKHNNSHENLEEPQNDTTSPKLPSPLPTSSTLSTPLSSTRTYITEIKVSTTEQDSRKSELGIPSPNSVSERIQKFDSLKGFNSSISKNHFSESSKIPVRPMKSETGQKVLETIQSLAKESSTLKTPEIEYAKKMASILSNSQKNEINNRKIEAVENEISRPNISGLYLKTFPKPSKDYSPTRKVPPVVPPRKMETSLSTKSSVTVELPMTLFESQEKKFVTFSSFRKEEPETLSKTTFKVKEFDEVNGRKEDAVFVKQSASEITFENQESKEGF